MSLLDSNQLRFLESVETIKELIRLRTGRVPSTSRAREIVACLQQGRQFFESAVQAPLETRPLVQFYGMLAFARALIAAKRGVALSTLSKSHGLKDVSSNNVQIADLQLRIERSGTFSDFNDVVGEANRIIWADNSGVYFYRRVPTASCASLADAELSLKDVLSRIPGLGVQFTRTFREPSRTIPLGYLRFIDGKDLFEVTLKDSCRIDSRATLKSNVERWRLRYPYLRSWRVTEAQNSWGKSFISFMNCPSGTSDDCSEISLPGSVEAGFEEKAELPAERVPPESLLGVGGGFGNDVVGIESVSGQYLSEYSLHYMALFLLSSLVRYRPDIWAHAVSRSSIQDRPLDDRCLALVELFLDENIREVSRLVIVALNPYEDVCWRSTI